MKNSKDSIPIDKLRDNINPIPLCTYDEIKCSILDHAREESDYPLRKGKIPYGGWKNGISTPPGYKGWNDSNRGSAMLAQKVDIDNEEYYLAIIDLDNKPNQKVPIEVLNDTFQDLMDDTYTIETPSGGKHIYLLSKKETARNQPPEESGIDYQITNYKIENSSGKYVVHNFRVDLISNGKTVDPSEVVSALKKEPNFEKMGNMEVFKYLRNNLSIVKGEYKKINNKDVLIVEDADTILDEKLLELQEKGYLVEKDLELGITASIINLLQKYVVEGNRNDLALGLSGFLRKNNFNLEETKIIFQKLFKDDEELQNRLLVVDSTFEKELSEIAGYDILNNILSSDDLVKLYDMINPFEDVDKELYAHFNRGSGKLGRNSALPKDILAITMMRSLKIDGYVLIKDRATMNPYVHHDNTGYVEVDATWISDYFNGKFHGMVGYKDCESLLKQVNNFKDKNYNLIEFSNGVLNTITLDFKENTKCKENLPKMKLKHAWNPKAKGERLEKFMINITETKKTGFENNYQTLKLAVGNSFMALNKEHLITALIGRPASGKTTFINYVMKKLFKFSAVSLKAIAERDRFSYYPLFNADINIDNDTSSCTINDIGNFNTVIEGNIPESEEKNANKRLQLPEGVGPKTWITANKLPKILGAGFERRLCLIWVDNVPFDKSFFNEEITNEEFEWLIYTSITELHTLNSTGGRIVDSKTSKVMNDVWRKNSDPIGLAVEHVFEFNPDKSIKSSEATAVVKKFLSLANKKGHVFDELARPSSKNIKKTMENNGYSQYPSGGYNKYDCCCIKENWEEKIDEVLN